MGLLSNSNAIESGGYNIERSLRFRSSASAYLSRTPAVAGNQKTWTWSGFVKRGTLGGFQSLFGATNSTQSEVIAFNADQIEFYSDAIASGTGAVRVSNAVYRDPSAWYHFVVTLDTTNATAQNRCRIWANGSEITSWATNYGITQNVQGFINNNVAHTFCRNPASSIQFFDGYLAEVNFIDGQALTPSSFGEFSTETGVWVPKKYTGTYGTNGFYLDFKTNTSPTTLAQDKSGNGNNWTANNISTTAGATYDSMTDVPTLTSATAANYAVLNPLLYSTYALSYGNLRYTHPNVGDDVPAYGTFGASSGKIYFEAYLAATGYVANRAKVGVTALYGDVTSSIGNTDHSYSYGMNGQKGTNSTYSAYGSAYAIGDTIGVALDIDAGTITFYKNNVSQGVAFSGLSAANGAFTFGVCEFNGGQWDVNFGQRPFSYTPPTGFKALNTFNLPDPVIKKPNQYMDATLATGNNGTQTIVNAGGFQPDFVWMKVRDIADNHISYDSVRGVQNYLSSNLTSAEGTNSQGLTSFNSNGFTLGNINPNYTGSHTFVAWQWKKGATPGFDIVTYTGTGVARTVSHNLGVAPKMIIVKQRSGVSNWETYHTSLGAAYYVVLDGTNAQINSTVVWNNTSPTSSVFSLGTGGNNTSGQTYVAYLFAEIPGFSKFGSYTGNGSADGPFVYCGFRPKYVMVKRTDSTGNWEIQDTSRSPYNQIGDYLLANASDAEVGGSVLAIDSLSNGFKVRTSQANQNASGGTYIFAAFAENPFKYSNAR